LTNKTGNIGFGNLTGLRPVTNNTTNTTAPTTNTIIDQDKDEDDDLPTTYKTMKISYNIYEKLRDHSHKYHDQPISYDEIIDELCTFYNEQHEKKYF
jgi:hypothetical protein